MVGMKGGGPGRVVFVQWVHYWLSSLLPRSDLMCARWRIGIICMYDGIIKLRFQNGTTVPPDQCDGASR